MNFNNSSNATLKQFKKIAMMFAIITVELISFQA